MRRPSPPASKRGRREQDGCRDRDAAAPAANPGGRAAWPWLARAGQRQIVGDRLQVGRQLRRPLVAVSRLGLEAAR